MNTKKYYISLIVLLIGVVGFTQTPEDLIIGTENSKNISFTSIFSDDRKVTIEDRSIKDEKPSTPSASPTPTTSTSTFPAGTTPADFSVSLSGGATYNIPIATPPGIRDISPNIGLNFNSQASNGLAGWGWGLSGLSTISKVSSTKFHDGSIDGVDFDSSDRFTLDGQRLLIKSGTYGAANSTYQTETYSNIKIKAYGTSPYGSSYGPSYFIVFYPDGSRVWYGNGTNTTSRLEWAIFRRVDPQGNTILYSYINDGELRAIDRIIFGNRSGNAPVEIKFYYKSRKRPEISYVKGITFKRNKILDRIETKGNGQLYRKYVLSHNETYLGYQKLINITEYNKANQSLIPVNFVYDNSSPNPNPDTYAGSIYPGYNYQTDNILSGEFNGDGKPDFIMYNKNSRNKIHIFDGVFDSSYGNVEIGRTYNVSNFDHIIGNSMLNHQGKKITQQGITLIKENLNGYNSSVRFKNYFHGSTGLYYHYTKTWNAPTYTYQNTPTSSTRKKIPKDYLSGDFNGDGLTDVLAIGKPYTTRYCYQYECPGAPDYDDDCLEQLKISKNDPFSNHIPMETKNVNENGENTESFRPPDFDCDDDDGGSNTCYTCHTYTSNYKTAYFIDLNRNLTSGFVNGAGSLQQAIKPTDRLKVADFNGDGKSDIFHFTEGKVYIYELNSYNRLSLIYSVSDTAIKMKYPILLADFNGDGKTDFLLPTADYTETWKFYISKGNSIYKYTKHIHAFMHALPRRILYDFQNDNAVARWALLESHYAANDMDGDGKADLIKNNIVTSDSNYSVYYTDEIVRIFTNHYDSSDNNPKFLNTDAQLFFEHNTGVARHGRPLFLDGGLFGNQNLQYAYLSQNRITAYEFEGDHRKDVTLKEVNNNGTKHLIDYAALTNQGVNYEQTYTSNYDEIYPYVNINIVPSLKLVSKVRELSGGMTRTQNFRYSGAVSHANGLGLFGFKQVIKSNIHGYGVQRLWNITEFDIHKRGSPKRNWVSTNPSSSPYSYISKTDYTYLTQLTSDKVYINVRSQVVSEDALSGITNTTAYNYGPYYSPTTVTTTFPGGSETVTQQYTNNPNPFDSSYTIGRLSDRTTTNVLNGDTFSSSEKYFYSNNLITQVRRKGNGTPWLDEYYQYDAFGNVLQKKVSGNGISDRIENFEFDSSGRYMTKSIDNEGLQTIYNYNIPTGNPTRVTNAYGLSISYYYDNWGRVTRETDYLGKHTYTNYTNNYTYGVGGKLKTINYSQGEDEKVYYNSLGWVMKEGVLSINNKWIFKSYEYDVAGKKLKESEPYFSTSNPTQWNRYSYDQYGRPIAQQLFTGKVINTTYNGLSATVEDGTRTMTSTKDAVGNTVSMQDNGGTINYTYYANGTMKSTNYDSHTVNVTIDGWGRKIALSDPSAGTYTYQYNILGEVLQETTPKGTTTYLYSPIGKLTKKTIVGDQTNSATDYEYDANTKLLKRMQSVDSETGTQYDYKYFYDNRKRINKITEDNGTADFEKQLTYDGYGRVNKETYISNNTTSGVSNTVTVKNVYDAAGILTEIRDFDTNTRLWKISSENARGSALNISLGNGMWKTKQYDQYGFLTKINDFKFSWYPSTTTVALKMDYNFDAQRGILNSRKNYGFTNWNESFNHDGLDRLTQINGPISETKAYDNRGRITTNSNVGAYQYDSTATYQLANVDLNDQGDLYYQQHKLQKVTYNAFKKPLKISQADKGRVNFEYGPLMNRTHAYYGGLQENIQDRQYHKQYSSIMPVEMVQYNTDNSTKIITYIGGDAYTAPIAHIKQVVGIDEYHYLHRDYLGSILAISNSSAEIVERRQFGAWGTTDQFVNLQGGTTFDHSALIGRGYTGHEHFFEVSLLHMNGRMYDAQLGRFLSPDNFIQDPYNTQSFNRYGYVWNNPLSYNDPSGEAISVLLAAIIIGAISGAAAYIGQAVRTGNWDWGEFGLAILGGAVVGALTGIFAPSIAAQMCFTTWWPAIAVVNGFVGAFLPTIDVPIGDWNISVSPTIAFGNASGIGASLSVSYSDGNWSFSAGIGYMNYGNYNGFGNGIEIRKSILAAYDDGRTGFSLATNWWGGKYKQQTGVIDFRSGDFKLRYENDGAPFGSTLGDGGDRFRTAALQLSVGDFSAGFNIFTGDAFDGLTDGQSPSTEAVFDHPSSSSRRPYLFGLLGKRGVNGGQYNGGTADKYRLGAAYIKYKGYKIGRNSEAIRHAIQNIGAHTGISYQPWYKVLNIQPQGYFQYQSANPYTLW